MNTTMLAARAHKSAPMLALDTVPVPELGDDDVLVKVASAGIAPGMLKLLERGLVKHLPTILGHEIAGTVVATGKRVDQQLGGKRVRVHPMLSCGDCVYCRSDREQLCSEAGMIGHAAFGDGPLALYARYHDGGLAEFARAPAALCDVLPDNVSFDVGAKVHDLANAVRALKCAGLQQGSRLAITAATGTMGTATIKLARFFGAREFLLIARSRDRLEGVKHMAGDLPVQLLSLDELGAGWQEKNGLTQQIRKLMPAGPDAVIDYFPDGPGSLQAAFAMALGGSLVHMGGNSAVPALPLVLLMQKCWRIVGTRACTRSDTDAVLQLLASGALDADELITHHFALADVNRAIDSMNARSEPMWMTVVRP